MIQLAKKPDQPPQPESPAGGNSAPSQTAAPSASAPPPPPPPPPPPQQGDDSAPPKKFSHMGNEQPKDDDDAEPPEPSALVKARERTVAFLIKHHKKLAIGTVAAVAASIAVYAGLTWFYGTVLFKSANEALAAKDYARAVRDFEAYQKFSGADEKSTYPLSRALLFHGDYAKIRAHLGNYAGENWEIHYVYAAGVYEQDPEKAIDLLNDITNKLGYLDEESRPGVVSNITYLRGLYLLMQNQYTSAARVFSGPYAQPRDEEYMREAFRFFLRTNQIKIAKSAPLPFDSIAEPAPSLSGVINYVFQPDSYDNSYGVPLRPSDLEHDAENAPAKDLFRASGLLAEVLSNPNEAANAAQKFRTLNPDTKSLLAHYITGYQLVLAGESAEAAKTYAAAAEFAPSSSVHQYHAAALWMGSNGAPPAPEVMEAYRKSFAANGQNLTALNNYAFLELYLGNVEQAKEASDKALAINADNRFAVINKILIGLAGASLDYEKALVETDSLLAEDNKSVLLVELAAQIRIQRKNIFGAVHFIQRLRDLRPDDPAVARRLADVRRHSGQLLLAVQETESALKAFPKNSDLLYHSAVYRAQVRDAKGANKALAQMSGEEQAFARARVNMIFSAVDDGAKAAQFGEQALKLAPPGERTAVAVDLARQHLELGNVGKAAAAHKVAAANVEYASFIDRNAILEALDLRVKAADGDASTEERITLLLEEASVSNNVFAQIDLCWALLSLDKVSFAITALEKIRTLQVQPPEVLMLALQSAYERSGQSANAEEIKTRIAAARKNIEKIAEGEKKTELPDDVKAIFAKGSKGFTQALNKAMKEKDYETVAAIYTEVINSKSDVAQKPAKNFQNRGAIYILLGRYEEAVADFAKALSLKDQLTPEEAQSVHYNYVNVLVQAKKYQRGIDEINAQLQSSPQFKQRTQYLQLLGVALSRVGRYRESAEAYQTLINEFPDRARYYINLAEVARVEENYPLAIKTLTSGLEVAPGNLKMREMLYRIYTSLGEAQNANRQLNFIKKIKNK